MLAELKDKELFNQARSYAFDYIDNIEKMDVFPSDQSLEKLKSFDEPLSEESNSAEKVLEQLHLMGGPNTIAQIGGRYFGFVNGNAIPASLGVKWLSDVWDQCGGLYLISPINAKLEAVCENWLKEIFKLPTETVAGFVSGTSMANLCSIAAARYQILKNLDWDVNENGLNGAPAIRILAHKQVHASIKKTLTLLGFGLNTIEWLESDDQGRLDVVQLPELDKTCILILQAGNANTGAFDNFDLLCDKAQEVGAWVHIDGAFGLWAGATKTLSYLTKGMENADSWAVDGHKTLNTPYDSGVVLCRHPQALVKAMQAKGEYIIFSEERDPMLYGPEMSKRSRAIEFWAAMKYLGKSGINEMVTGFHLRAKQMEEGISKIGFNVLNEVVFNQVLISGESDFETNQVLEYIQKSGKCWCGGTTWNGKAAIRISICSWRTDQTDIETTLEVFRLAKINASIANND